MATKTSAIIDLPDVNGAFVGNTLRPFTKEAFGKIKTILANKKKCRAKLAVTVRAAGLAHLVDESGNGKPDRHYSRAV